MTVAATHAVDDHADGRHGHFRRVGVVDVHYPRVGGAHAALVVYGDERCAEPVSQHTEFVPDVEPYQAGQFWRRELPPLLAVLALASPLHLLIIDGYVDLDGAGRPGLGARLHAETGYTVIGIAKTAFRGADHAAPVLRGRSTRPLLVTAIGLSLTEAADLVQAMAGANRIPIAVSAVDRLCRSVGQGYER